MLSQNFCGLPVSTEFLFCSAVTLYCAVWPAVVQQHLKYTTCCETECSYLVKDASIKLQRGQYAPYMGYGHFTWKSPVSQPLLLFSLDAAAAWSRVREREEGKGKGGGWFQLGPWEVWPERKRCAWWSFFEWVKWKEKQFFNASTMLIPGKCKSCLQGECSRDCDYGFWSETVKKLYIYLWVWLSALFKKFAAIDFFLNILRKNI